MAAKKVVVTEEMLARFPAWGEAGIAVGDKIAQKDLDEAEAELAKANGGAGVDKEDEEEAVVEDKPKKGGKHSGLYAVVTKGGEYIRTYEDKEVAEGFAAKSADRLVIDAASIKHLIVSFDVLDKKSGLTSQKTEKFDREDDAAALRLKAAERGTCTFVRV